MNSKRRLHLIFHSIYLSLTGLILLLAPSFAYGQNISVDSVSYQAQEEFPKVIIKNNGATTTRYYYYRDHTLDAIEVSDDTGNVFYEEPDSSGEFKKVTVRKLTPQGGFTEGVFVPGSNDTEPPQLKEYRESKKPDFTFKPEPLSNKAAAPPAAGCGKNIGFTAGNILEDMRLNHILEKNCIDYKKKLNVAFKIISPNANDHTALDGKVVNDPITGCLKNNYPQIWAQIAGEFYSQSQLWSCDPTLDQPKIRPVPFQITLSKDILAETPANLPTKLLDLLIQNTHVTAAVATAAMNCDSKKSFEDVRISFNKSFTKLWSDAELPQYEAFNAWLRSNPDQLTHLLKKIATHPVTLPCPNTEVCKKGISAVYDEITLFCQNHQTQISASPATPVSSCAELGNGLKSTLSQAAKECSVGSDVQLSQCVLTQLPKNSVLGLDSNTAVKAEAQVNQVTPTAVTSNESTVTKNGTSSPSDPSVPMTSNFDEGSASFYSAALSKYSAVANHTEEINAEPMHITQSTATVQAPSALAVNNVTTPTSVSQNTIASRVPASVPMGTSAPSIYASADPSQFNVLTEPLVSKKSQMKVAVSKPPPHDVYTLTTNLAGTGAGGVATAPVNSKLTIDAARMDAPKQNLSKDAQWLKQLVLTQGNTIVAFLSTPWIADQLAHFNVKIKLLIGTQLQEFGPKTAKEEWVVKRNTQQNAT